MIRRETANALAYSYAEIEAAEKLLKELSDSKSDRREPDFRDAFGRRRGLQLGVPPAVFGTPEWSLCGNCRG
jgi:hypothetical protein